MLFLKFTGHYESAIGEDVTHEVKSQAEYYNMFQSYDVLLTEKPESLPPLDIIAVYKVEVEDDRYYLKERIKVCDVKTRDLTLREFAFASGAKLEDCKESKDNFSIYDTDIGMLLVSQDKRSIIKKYAIDQVEAQARHNVPANGQYAGYVLYGDKHPTKGVFFVKNSPKKAKHVIVHAMSYGFHPRDMKGFNSRLVEPYIITSRVNKSRKGTIASIYHIIQNTKIVLREEDIIKL